MATPSNFSDVVANHAFWDRPEPDHDTLLAAVGSTSQATRNVCKASLLSFAAHSPIVLAFSLSTDPNYVYVGHSPTLMAPDPMETTPYDNATVVFIGDNLATALPVVLPDTVYTNLQGTRARRFPHMLGGQGFAAATPVVRFDIPDPSETEADELRARGIFVLPHDQNIDALTTNSNGRYTNAEFYQAFIDPGLNGDPAAIAAVTPLAHWFRLHCTNDNNGDGVNHVTPIEGGTPPQKQVLGRVTRKFRDSNLTKLGGMGPAVTTTAFQAGMASIANVMNRNQADHISFLRDQGNKTFTEKHGPDLAGRLHRWCDVGDDATLPQIHRLMAKSHKSRDYGIVQAAIEARLATHVMPLSSQRSPLATPKLIDDVFRNFAPACDNQVFGEGLSPFSIVCIGHKEAHQVRESVRRAKAVEDGGSMSLADATAIATTDVRFADTIQVGTEKCYGFSILVDLFHGEVTTIAQSIRAAVLAIAPYFSPMVDNMGGLEVGMDYVNRVMYAITGQYHLYLANVLVNPACNVPTFEWITEALRTGQYDRFSQMPAHWYSLASAPKNPIRRLRDLAEPAHSTRSQAGAVPQVNARPNDKLLARFASCGSTSISQMMEGHSPSIPKHKGEDVCLTWAFKGECSPSCKRKKNHVHYPPPVVHSLHSLLDTCGVAPSSD